MELKIREEQGIQVVSVIGDLTSGTTGAFYDRVLELRNKAETKIVLDLHEVTYLDSMGAGQLWRTVEAARESGGATVLAALPPVVRKTLDLIGMSGELDIVDTVEEAVRKLAG